jgi:crotonobetainyl-CoA:carnitine CoA-transferase CaiB-like acyl-CoA transferase
MGGALQHIKVLDLSRILAGPWATQILADMGADVLKVERPGQGDDTRSWGPPFLEDGAGRETRDSSYFLSANRGKKSITLDISHPEGQRMVRELARTSDVLIENYKVGTLARYGLSFEDLRKTNPRLIFCSVTGFGQDGPYAPLPGYDFVFQGMSGLMSITGQPSGTPGDEPMKVGIAMSDLITGMYVSTAVLAALEERHVSGEGQYIDIALLDCTTAITSYQAINYLLSGKVPVRLGNAHSNMVPYQMFRCLSGDVIVAVGNDNQFTAYCGVIDRSELATDERFKTVAQRNRNRKVLIPLLAEAMLRRTMEDWIARMEAANVPCGPINNLAEVFADPQVKHRRMLQMLPHAAGVDAPTVASPIRFSRTPIVHRRSAPLLGQHTDEVLRERLSLDPGRIAELRASGII